MHLIKYTYTCISQLHSRTQTIHILIKLPNYYKFTPYTYKCTNLGATCGALTEALAEALGTTEDVVG